MNAPFLRPDGRESSSALDRVVVVLDHSKNVVNIAATLRAMMNMGLSRLRLVNPDEFDPWRIDGIAHGSQPFVEATEIFDTLEEALADTVWVVGTSARARTANRNYGRPRPLMKELVEKAADGTVALLFGREDRGLDNQALDLCHQIAIIPTDEEYTSLNLAQAALLMMYELHMATGGGADELPEGRRATRPATRDELEQMYRALESGMERIDFFKARKPEAVMRTIRTILSGTEIDQRESRLLGAIGYEIGNWIDRHMDALPDGSQDDDSPKPDPKDGD